MCSISPKNVSFRDPGVGTRPFKSHSSTLLIRTRINLNAQKISIINRWWILLYNVITKGIMIYLISRELNSLRRYTPFSRSPFNTHTHTILWKWKTRIWKNIAVEWVISCLQDVNILNLTLTFKSLIKSVILWHGTSWSCDLLKLKVTAQHNNIINMIYGCNIWSQASHALFQQKVVFNCNLWTCLITYSTELQIDVIKFHYLSKSSFGVNAL